MTTKRLIIVAFAISITVVQEEILLLIPNVQFTILLVILFSRFFTFKESFIYILVYVFLDSLYMGTLNPFYMIPMFLGWMLIPVSQVLFLHKTTKVIYIALFGLIFGFLYSWMYIPFQMVEQGITDLWPYLIKDIPFELILAGTGFLSVYLIYEPLELVLNNLFKSEGIIQNNQMKSLPKK